MTNYDSAVLSKNPILYIPGTTQDQGSGKYPIALHGSPSASGRTPDGGPAWHFDASGTQFLSIADPADGSLSIDKTGKLTVEFWMQLDAMNQPHNAPGLNGGCEILGKAVSNNTPQVATDGCEWLFRYYSANSTDGGNTPTDVCFYVFNKNCGFGAGNDDHIDQVENGYTKTVDDWYYWCGVYDTSPQSVSGVNFPYGTVTIYGGIYGNSRWNGVFLNRTGLQIMWASGQPIIRPSHTSTPLTIGACGLSSAGFAPEGTESFFNGKIGKFAVYNRALTPAEIQANFAAMSNVAPPPPPPPPVITVPSPPGAVTASAGDGSATVHWAPPLSDGGSPITGYTIIPYVGTAPQAGWHVAGNATSVIMTGLINGTTYTFEVSATNAVGTGAYVISNSVTPSPTPPPPPPPPPPSPTGFNAPTPQRYGFTIPTDTLRCRATFTNHGTSPVTLRVGCITSRPPGGTHDAGPFDDLHPLATNVVVQPGASYQLASTRRFQSTDRRGMWEIFATWQDTSGDWHDGPPTLVSVK